MTGFACYVQRVSQTGNKNLGYAFKQKRIHAVEAIVSHLVIFVLCTRIKKDAPYLSVKVFSAKVLFYVVIRATRRTSRLKCKASTFISQLF